MECQSKWNVTQIGISNKMKCYLKWNVTQQYVTQKAMALKIECHSILNFTQY